MLQVGFEFFDYESPNTHTSMARNDIDAFDYCGPIILDEIIDGCNLFKANRNIDFKAFEW